jgi:hypothetical protein
VAVPTQIRNHSPVHIAAISKRLNMLFPRIAGTEVNDSCVSERPRELPCTSRKVITIRRRIALPTTKKVEVNRRIVTGCALGISLWPSERPDLI